MQDVIAKAANYCRNFVFEGSVAAASPTTGMSESGFTDIVSGLSIVGGSKENARRRDNAKL